MVPHVKAWASDRGEETATQPSAGTTVRHVAPIAPVIPPAIPMDPETQPSLLQIEAVKRPAMEQQAASTLAQGRAIAPGFDEFGFPILPLAESRPLPEAALTSARKVLSLREGSGRRMFKDPIDGTVHSLKRKESLHKIANGLLVQGFTPLEVYRGLSEISRQMNKPYPIPDNITEAAAEEGLTHFVNLQLQDVQNGNRLGIDLSMALSSLKHQAGLTMTARQQEDVLHPLSHRVFADNLTQIEATNEDLRTRIEAGDLTPDQLTELENQILENRPYTAAMTTVMQMGGMVDSKYHDMVDNTPLLAQQTGNIAGSISGRTVGGGRRIQEQIPGMETERDAERIEGAFGFEFGQRFSGEKEAVVPAEVKNFWNDYLKGKWWYKVQPTTPNKLFSDYYLLLTPKSSSIVGILAVKDYSQVWPDQSGIESDLTECLQDRNAVFSILKRKYYSESSTPNVESRLRHRGGDTLGIFSIEQNVGNEIKKRWVSVHCNGILDLRRSSFGRHLRLTIVYGDLEMNKLHNREVGEYVLESNDPSGF